MATTVSSKTVRFGAVEFPASLKAASAKSDVKLDRARRYTHDGKVVFEPITRKDVGKDTGEVADSENIVHGQWMDETDFRPLTPQQVAALKALGETEERDGTVHDLTALDIEQFVPLKDVPFERSESAYFLTPQKGGVGSRPMRLLHDALKAEKKAGVFKFVVKGGGRQKLGVIHPSGGRLLVNVLAFAGDFAQANEGAEAIEAIAKPDKRYLDLTRSLIQALTADVGESLIETAEDTAVAAKAKALDDLREGKQVAVRKVDPAAAAEQVDDLMAKLLASVPDKVAA